MYRKIALIAILVGPVFEAAIADAPCDRSGNWRTDADTLHVNARDQTSTDGWALREATPGNDDKGDLKSTYSRVLKHSVSSGTSKTITYMVEFENKSYAEGTGEIQCNVVIEYSGGSSGPQRRMPDTAKFKSAQCSDPSVPSGQPSPTVVCARNFNPDKDWYTVKFSIED